MNLFQSLINLYDNLYEQKKLTMEWDPNGKVDYGLDLNDDGTVFQIIPFKEDNKSKNMIIPAYGKSDNGEKFKYFCCASSKFLLGYKTKLSDKTKHEAFFNTIADYTKNLVATSKTDECKAIYNFFDRYYNNVNELHNSLGLSEENEAIYAGQKFILCYDGKPVFEYDSIKEIWDNEFLNNAKEEDLTIERSIISGNVGPIARIHNGIPISGNAPNPALISCKSECSSFQSYFFTEGNNAHVSIEDMLKYTTALKYLIKTELHRTIMQDVYILSWAEDGNECYDTIIKKTMFDTLAKMVNDSSESNKTDDTEKLIHDTLRDIANGKSAYYNKIQIDPNMKFYLLGLTNDGRASVKFFIENSFSNYAINIVDHMDRMSMPNNEYNYLSIKQICKETVRESADFSTILYNKLLMSILNNTKYPDQLLSSVLARTKIEFGTVNIKSKNQNLIRISTRKAQIIKMILLKNYNITNEKELSMNVNDGSLPYNLGKVFAICEKIQEDTRTNKNIGGLYFSTAMTSPAKAFPSIIKAAQMYLGKLSEGQQVNYNKLLQSVLTNVDNFPTHLNNVEQGEFCLGYYHQRQSLFAKKENNEDNTNIMEEIE